VRFHVSIVIFFRVTQVPNRSTFLPKINGVEENQRTSVPKGDDRHIAKTFNYYLLILSFSIQNI